MNVLVEDEMTIMRKPILHIDLLMDNMNIMIDQELIIITVTLAAHPVQ